MKVHAYLNFDGNTEEAFNFYKTVFGSEFSSIQRFKDVPGNPFPPEEAERVMHVGLRLGDSALMGSDISPALGHKLIQGNGTYISLEPDTIEDGARIYNALSEGGKIEMEWGKQFWGDYFASFTDKFGVKWMLNIADKQQ